MADSTSNVTWGKIKSSYGTRSSTSVDTNIPQQVQQSELDKIYYGYKVTRDKINSGRKRNRCKKCGEVYFMDEGISGGFCKLDCKYSNCIIEEENDAKET